MAANNINKRRKAVAQLIKSRYITSKKIKDLAKKFGCHHGSIILDIAFIKSQYKYTVLPSCRTKEEIKMRDNHTCQYCGTKKPPLFIDHIIPVIRGGHGEEYNLVACCPSCNTRKSKYGGVWVPDNIDLIRQLNEKYANRIVRYAKPRMIAI